MAAHPARVDHGHEDLRQVAYRERGRALRELREAARAVLDEWGRGGEDWYRPCFEDRLEELGKALACWVGINDTDAAE